MDLIVDVAWCAKLAYLADIFHHLNELNSKCKVEMRILSPAWINCMSLDLSWPSDVEKVAKGTIEMFTLESTSDPTSSILVNAFSEHLKSLEEKFSLYFPST